MYCWATASIWRRNTGSALPRTPVFTASSMPARPTPTTTIAIRASIRVKPRWRRRRASVHMTGGGDDGNGVLAGDRDAAVGGTGARAVAGDAPVGLEVERCRPAPRW